MIIIPRSVSSESENYRYNIISSLNKTQTMVNGEISEWFIAEGDHFKEGQAILQVDTDKATMAYNATEEGYLAKILMPAGSSKVHDNSRNSSHLIARRT